MRDAYWKLSLILESSLVHAIIDYREDDDNLPFEKSSLIARAKGLETNPTMGWLRCYELGFVSR